MRNGHTRLRLSLDPKRLGTTAARRRDGDHPRPVGRVASSSSRASAPMSSATRPNMRGALAAVRGAREATCARRSRPGCAGMIPPRSPALFTPRSIGRRRCVCAALRGRWRRATAGERRHDAEPARPSWRIVGGLRARARYLSRTMRSPRAARRHGSAGSSARASSRRAQHPDQAMRDAHQRSSHRMGRPRRRGRGAGPLPATGRDGARACRGRRGVRASRQRSGHAARRASGFSTRRRRLAFDRDLDGRDRIVAGIEFDSYGRRIAYHILRELDPDRARARAGVRRGARLPRRCAGAGARGVVVRARHPEAVRPRQGERRARHAACRSAPCSCGFIVIAERRDGAAAVWRGRAGRRGGLVDGLEPGTLKTLAPGEDIRLTDPPSLGAESVQFLTLTAREIAGGLGLPYEALSGDLSQVNYSSIRAGLVEWRRALRGASARRARVPGAPPDLSALVTSEVLRGALAAPGFFDDPEPWLAVRLHAAAKRLGGPAKDVQAERDAIKAGLMSRRQAVAARGYDLEALDLEIAADNARAAALGLNFATAPAPAAQGVTAMTFFDRLFHRDAAETLTRRAPAAAASSWNAETRTFERRALDRRSRRAAGRARRFRRGPRPRRRGASRPHPAARQPCAGQRGSRARARRQMRVVKRRAGRHGHALAATTRKPSASRSEISDGARFGLSRRLPRRALGATARRTAGAPARRPHGTCSKHRSSPSAPTTGPGCERNTNMTTRTRTGIRARQRRDSHHRPHGRARRATWADGLDRSEATIEAGAGRSLRGHAPAQRHDLAHSDRRRTCASTTTARAASPQWARRSLPASTPSHRASDRARQYVGLRIPDFARECLRSAGISTTGLSDASVIAARRDAHHERFPAGPWRHRGPHLARRLHRRAVARCASSHGSAPRPTSGCNIALWLSAGGFKLLKVNEAGEFRRGHAGRRRRGVQDRDLRRAFSRSADRRRSTTRSALSRTCPRTLGTSAAALEADVLADVLNSIRS